MVINCSTGVADGFIDLLFEADENQLVNSSANDNGIVTLNGMTDVIILPLSGLDVSFGPSFVVSSWIKHQENNIANVLEQILCLANGIGPSYDCHMSLAIQNKCHLLFSLHPESVVGEALIRNGKLGPTLWKWRLHQVCDAQWHHYIVIVQYPQV